MHKAKVVQPLVYVDACVYIDLVMKNGAKHAETGEERWKSAAAVFDAVNENDIRLASSSLVEAEVGCNGEARKDKQHIRDLLSGWFTARSTEWVEMDRSLAREAIHLTNLWQGKGDGKKMSAADTLHLAAAVRLNADYFMTHDKGFPIGHNVEGVQVIRPGVVWQESLLKQASGE